MGLYVLKFGGSSVATTSRIKHVAEIISKHISNDHKVVVVTSAMQGVTNQLIELTKAFSNSSFNREYDSIISSGEQVAAGLLAMCLNSMDIPSKSLNAWQIPIKIVGEFSNAVITNINKEKIFEELKNNITPVITGFQGVSENGDIFTIGRGGSDATACAISSAISANECFIYTDVDGVYTADPRIVLNSKRLSEISYDEMLELAYAGAKVLQYRSIIIAKQYNVKLRVLSSFSDTEETFVTNKTSYVSKNKKIAGVAHNLNMAIVNINGNFDFDKIKHFELNSIMPNLFIFPKTFQHELKVELEKFDEISYEFDNNVGVVTIVGDINSNKDNTKDIVSEIENNSIKVKYIYEQKMSKSIILPFQQTEEVVNILHKYFFE